MKLTNWNNFALTETILPAIYLKVKYTNILYYPEEN